MTLTAEKERLLEPLTKTKKGFVPFMAIPIVVLAWGLVALWTQLRYGFQVTGLNNTVVWGLYISTFVFFMGVKDGGILITAIIRVMKLERYKPISRMAEVLTITALVAAVLAVIVDLTRPDRWYIFLTSLRFSSPLAWDFSFIAIYFIVSALYLLLTLKEDILEVRHIAPRGTGWIYGMLVWFYDRATPKSHEAHQKLLDRFALLMLPFPVIGSGMVVPFIFSVLVAKPTWNVPFFGPYFLGAAALSGVAVVVLLAAVFRKVFGWEDILEPGIFKGLGRVMLVLIPVYTYFTFLEHFTSQYVQATPELTISDYLLTGPYASVFWSMMILSFVFPFLLLVFRRTVRGVFVASLLVTLGIWVNRVILVVPTLVHSNLPFELGSYSPTWVEWSVIAGILALLMLLYSAFVKVFPIIELDIYD